MKKTFYILFCAAFMGACLFFFAGAVFFPPDTDAEGRELSPFPAFMEDGQINTAFFTELDTYLTERFSLRQKLISANNHLKETVFATGSNQVIVGRNGFLFYGDTVGDYTGDARLTDEEIGQAADALLLLSEYCAAHDAEFIVAVAPNKNTIYGDNMPAVYRRCTEATNLDRLHDALRERGVSYTDLRAALLDSDTLLYHKRDTHWNGMGALAAYNAILDSAGIAHERYESFSPRTTADFPGDLDGMLYPGEKRYDENTVPDFDFSEGFIYTGAAASDMDLSITTRGGGTGSVLMFRDSFGSALIPYFSTAFAQARYERAVPYRIDILEQYDADLVIVEIAERNIEQLITAADRLMDGEAAAE